MSDDWSLEDKERYAPNIVGREITTRKEAWIVYDKPNIDVLREKLIEDFNKEIDNINHSWWNAAMSKSIDLINKRFGVEEK